MFGIGLALGCMLALTGLASSSEERAASNTTAEQLLEIVASRESIRAGLNEQFDAGLISLLSQRPEYENVLRSNPNAIRSVAAAAHAVIGNQIDRDIHELWREGAALLSSEMTEGELAQLLAYYRSPTGRNVMAVARDTYDDDPSHCTGLSWSDEQSCRRRVPNAMARLSLEDREALNRVAQQPGFVKLATLMPRLLEIEARWSQPSEQESAEIPAAIENAIRPYIH